MVRDLFTLGTSSVPAWIGALSTLGLGLVGAFFTWFQWQASGFRPKVKGNLAVGNDSVRITITNSGRLEGRINMVEVLDANYRRIPLLGSGDTFSPFSLGGRSAEVLDFNAPTGRDFGPTDRVRIAWGAERIAQTLSRFGLASGIPTRRQVRCEGTETLRTRRPRHSGRSAGEPECPQFPDAFRPGPAEHLRHVAHGSESATRRARP